MRLVSVVVDGEPTAGVLVGEEGVPGAARGGPRRRPRTAVRARHRGAAAARTAGGRVLRGADPARPGAARRAGPGPAEDHLHGSQLPRSRGRGGPGGTESAVV